MEATEVTRVVILAGVTVLASGDAFRIFAVRNDGARPAPPRCVARPH